MSVLCCHCICRFTCLSIADSDVPRVAGKVITAAYVPLINYHSLFPDAMAAQTLLLPLRAQRL